jgi:glutathione synthase/RimK-type ligase-like ATP-grasp enzyme
MKKLSVAIVKSDFHGKHSTSWSNVWLDYCVEAGITHKLVDWRALNAFDEMARHDIVMWHYSNYSQDEMLFARNILLALKAAGCRVFPDTGDADHFDDKVAQAYLLRGLGIGTPCNYPLHSPVAVEQWNDEVGKFPVVAKLRTGSGASNVQLIHNVNELRNYSKRMFGKGVDGKPSTVFKIKSNVASARSVSELVARLRRAPEFFFSRRRASGRPRERGYVYLQEFVPGVDYDLKVVVVGDQLSYVARAVRKGDFRASGGGALFYDHALVDQVMIDAAFHAADALRSDCTGFDMIKDPRTGRPVILEVSYGFSHTAQLGANGHFDRRGSWHDTPLNPPRLLLHRLVNEVVKQ